MARFTYLAIGQDGKEKKGLIEASDDVSAKFTLKEDGLIPLKIEKAGALNKEISILPKKVVKARDLSVFCRQMNSILDSGITIVTALNMLAQQMGNKRFRQAVEEARTVVEKGESLSVALGKNPKVFPSILVNMVAAGEASGTLDRTFERMAIHFEKSAKLASMVKKAMIYPVILSIVAVIVITVMSVVVVPRFVSLFETMGTELPLVTKIVVGISNFTIHNWYIIILALVLAVGGIRYSKQTEKGQRFWSLLKIKMPIFGPLATKNMCANFSRTMSTLISSGISLSEALDITGKSLENVIFKGALENARQEIERGTTLSEPLRESGLFPVMVYQMLSIGEETGNVEGMLTKVADYYEEEVEIITGNLNAAMEPLIIVVMGIIIGFIAIAIYMPIIEMYNGMGNL